MALIDRPGFSALNEWTEEHLGFGLRPSSELERLSVMEREFTELASDAEDLAMHSLDYFSGRPQELNLERRRRIAQRSRVALKFDPNAGAEAQLLADFAFGKGVPIPTAKDEKVQEIIEEAWTDANNEEKLTGYMAQRKLSNELLTTGELFVTAYFAGGKIRVGRLDPDTVDAVVPDPEDRLRPLWYMVRERRYEWDFTMDAPKIEGELLDGSGRRKVRYWKHWRNYDDAVAERTNSDTSDEVPLETPPSEKIADGVVFHVAINQTGEELRGNPPWARALRYFNAMNVLTEAHVAMAQARSTFIARRQLKGSPKQVTKAASSVLSHVSELGSGLLSPARGQAEGPAAFAPGAPSPMPPASWWSENESSKLEALNLSSGAGEMAISAQIVRAPIAAQSGFGQHYFGDAGNANLATASTLELPSTMHIESWQELLAQMYRWFTDRAIESAAKAGRLGGMDGFPEDGPMSELRLHEAEDRAAMERRTKKDLSYEFVMPFPGRRQLTDVETFVSDLSAAFDPNGVNIPLRRHLLRFAFEQIGIGDVGAAVMECIPDKPMEGGIGPPSETTPEGLLPGNAFGQAPPPGGPQIPGGQPAPVEGERPKGVRRQSTPPGEKPMSEQAWIPPELAAGVQGFESETVERFRRLVTGSALEAVLALSSNGNGSQG